MGSGLPADDPLVNWNREHVQRQFAAWRARTDPKCVQTLGHLDPATVFKLNESERPPSVDLAVGLGLAIPERRVLRRITELTRPTPAVLGYRSITANAIGGIEALGATGQRCATAGDIERPRGVTNSESAIARIASHRRKSWRPDPTARAEVIVPAIFLICLGLSSVALGLAISPGMFEEVNRDKNARRSEPATNGIERSAFADRRGNIIGAVPAVHNRVRNGRSRGRHQYGRHANSRFGCSSVDRRHGSMRRAMLPPRGCRGVVCAREALRPVRKGIVP